MRIEGKDYELVLASETFDDDNNGYEFGINWLDEFGYVLDCEWFKTEEERQANLHRTNFNIVCQEAWETVGNATQIDEGFVDILYRNLFNKV